MTELEQYLFALQEFLVIENALTSIETTTINQLLDQLIAQVNEPHKPWIRFDSLLDWGKEFRALIDNPRITPYLSTLIEPGFRLDHDYVHIIRQGRISLAVPTFHRIGKEV